MLVAHGDFETRSTTDLNKSGVSRYAEDPHTGIWCLGYAVGDDTIRVWTPDDPEPTPLLDHIANGGWFAAFNAPFELEIWNKVLIRRYQPHWPQLQVRQTTCVMARALAVNLPGSLEKLAPVLGLPGKDLEGGALMKRMMRPLRYQPDGTPIWNDHPDNIKRLSAYCAQDVYVEREASKLLPELSPSERELWELDRLINDRGIMIDRRLVERASELVEYALRQANAEIRRLTNGAVSKVTEISKIVEWLNSRGIQCERLRKGDQEELIVRSESMFDFAAAQVIELRRNAAKTSVAKYGKMLECVCEDDYVRQLLQFDGAAQTGRWAGRLVQPQNYPRVDEETEAVGVDYVVRTLLDERVSIPEAFSSIELLEPPRLPNGDRVPGMSSLAWLSKCLRATIIAAPGARLLGVDFSNIEGRVNTWLANETWKLEAFEAYDLGYGPDLYKVAYARSFGVDVKSVTKPQRQLGKVQELALGYQGGVGAFLTMTQTYMMRLAPIVNAVVAAVDAQEWDTVAKVYPSATDKSGLDERMWTGIKIVVRRWRAAHPMIVQSWWDLQDAAIEAVENPNTRIPVYGGRVAYLFDGSYLLCGLPSGRAICYPQAHVSQVKTEQVLLPDGEWYDTDTFFPDELDLWLKVGCEVKRKYRRQVFFWGLNDNKQWSLQYLYGGLQCENIVQATSRCLLDAAMKRIERAGYPVHLTVHDEVLAQLRKDVGTVPDFKRLMEIRPAWAATLPIVAAAWEDERYVK